MTRRNSVDFALRHSLGRLNAMHRLKAALRPLLIPRRFQAFVVGTARSGTHSVASLFSPNYRTTHEIDSERFIRLVLDRVAHKKTRADIKQYLSRRDTEHRLEMDSSQLNVWAVEELVSLFPRAKFILTVWEPKMWLSSIIDHSLYGPSSPAWRALREHRFGPLAMHPPEERSLQEAGVYTVDGYVGYWAWHNRRVLDTVPRHRLLAVPTERIQQDTDLIANFLDIPAQSLAANLAHSNKRSGRSELLEQLDPNYLEAKYRRYCARVMAEITQLTAPCRSPSL